ncbi:MAG: CarD family transcriptional regulator, partial [Pseudomonadota bacterium]
PQAPVTLDHQADAALTARLETIRDHHGARVEAGRMGSSVSGGGVSGGSVSGGGGASRPLPPELLYLDEEGWQGVLAGRPIRAFTPHRTSPGPGVIDAGGRPGRSFAPERQQEGANLFGALANHLRAKLREGPVVIATYSEGARERLSGLLAEQGLSDTETAEDWRGIRPGLTLMVWALEAGFTCREATVVAEQDVLGDRLIRRGRRSRRAENFLTEAQSLMTGDLVVHVDHGIGRYLGLETVQAAGAPHECLSLDVL